jgi:hypothetical protein
MLALDSQAQIFSSTEVNYGLPPTGGFAVGELDDEQYIHQSAYRERSGIDPISGTLQFIATPDETVVEYLYDADAADFLGTTLAGVLKKDPNNTSQYLVFRKLHIVYPADPSNNNILVGTRRFPVVILVHGQHAWSEPNHQGYIYLQKELASWGIVSISVDTNAANALGSYIEMRAEMVLGALDTIHDFDADMNSRFHQRLDLTKVGLMGHSRGGDAVVRAAIINADPSARILANIKNKYAIKAVCSLAPTDISGTSNGFLCKAPTAGPGTDVYSPNALNPSHCGFYAVIYGALDGDVAGEDKARGATGTGFRHYDRANTQKSMVVLDACNHNSFNDVWTTPEYYIPIHDPGRILTPEHHRILAKEYIGGLFRWQLLGTSSPQFLFDGTATNSLSAHASIQHSFGKSVVELDSMENPADPARTLSGSEATVEEIADVTITKIPLITKNVADYTNHQTSVLHLAPTTVAEPYKRLLVSVKDWSQYDLFTFRVCIDVDVTTAATTAAAILPHFTLVFYGTGQSEEVTAASISTSNRPSNPVFHNVHWFEYVKSLLFPGTFIHTEKFGNCTVIRLETLFVDLATLSIDRTKMTAIALKVPSAFAEHQFFDSFQLVKR